MSSNNLNVNSNPVPVLSISNAEVFEGDSYNEEKYLEFKISLDRPSLAEITIGLNGYDFGEDFNNFNTWLDNYEYMGNESKERHSSSPNFASFMDDYYYPLWDTEVTFAPGETQKTYRVDINPDLEVEDSEKLYLRIDKIVVNDNGTILENGLALGKVLNISDGLGVGTIIDNDGAATSLQYRINVGGKKVAAADGSIDWSEDTNTNPSIHRIGSGGAKIAHWQTDIDLSDASLPPSVTETIFQSERWDPLTGSAMEWEFDVVPGDYEIRLFFAETYSRIDEVGERVFDVAVEGLVPEAFKNIDVFASVGQYAGLMLSNTTTVSDGSLSLEFIHKMQNPALKGIEILSVQETVV